MKNYEVLKADLDIFEYLEDHQKEALADYFACPSSEDCRYDGIDNGCCAECKVKWLESEWED